MKFKNIEDFTEQDCLNFLENGSGNAMSEQVRNRLRQIRTEKQADIKKAEYDRAQRILELERKTQWIDIEQFLEKRKYKSRRGVIATLFVILFLVLSSLAVSLYFANTEHYMHSDNDYEQVRYTSGIENIWLKLGFITTPYLHMQEDADGHIIFDDNEIALRKTGYYCYKISDTGISFPVLISILTLLLIFVFWNYHSPLVNEIYNIEDKDKKKRIRAIENKHGKKGLCHTGITRIKSLLPMEYDSIFPISETAYVCKKGGKFGLYNTELKKMVQPVIYDKFVSCDNNTITFGKGAAIFPFSHKGYRIIN